MFSSISRLVQQRFFLIPLAIALAFSTGCRIQQESAGEAPEINVEPGRLPEYNVEGPDVNIETEEVPVTVPEVQVKEKEGTIEVPRLEIEAPGSNPEQ
jgi:hypothetical protein